MRKRKIIFFIGIPQAFHTWKLVWGYANYGIAIRTSAWDIYDKKNGSSVDIVPKFSCFSLKNRKICEN